MANQRRLRRVAQLWDLQRARVSAKQEAVQMRTGNFWDCIRTLLDGGVNFTMTEIHACKEPFEAPCHASHRHRKIHTKDTPVCFALFCCTTPHRECHLHMFEGILLGRRLRNQAAKIVHRRHRNRTVYTIPLEPIRPTSNTSQAAASAITRKSAHTVRRKCGTRASCSRGTGASATSLTARVSHKT